MSQLEHETHAPTLPIAKPWVAAAVVGVLYFLLARLSLELVWTAESVAVFWPAAGLAGGAMVSLSRDARRFVPFAVLIAAVAAILHAGQNLAGALGFGLCNAFQCILFCRLIEKLDATGRRLESPASVASFLFAVVGAVAVSALAATAAIVWLGLSMGEPLLIWWRSFQADTLGIISLAPLLMTLPAVIREVPRPLMIFEGMVGATLAPFLTFGAFSLVYSNVLSPMTPRFALLPLFLWLAARTPAVFPALCAFLMSVAMVAVVVTEGLGNGGSSGEASERLIGAMLVILSGCLITLTLTAMFARLRNQAVQLRSSDRRLRLALEAGRMYAFEYDHSTGLVHRVGGLVERLGLSEKGRPSDFVAVLQGDDKESIDRMYGALSPAQPKCERLLKMVTNDGEVLSVEHRAEAEFDGKGALMRIYGTCVDVTQLKSQAEELRAALNAGRVYAFEYDVVKGTARRSENAAEILGVPAEVAQSSNKLIFDLVHPDDRGTFLRFGKGVQANTTKTGVFRLLRQDGRIGWLETSIHVTTDAEGKVLAVRGLARDVSDKVRAEQRQELLIRELDHRVKNALARMAVVVELSKEDHQTLDEYVEVIRGRIQSMARTHERLSGSKWTGVGIATIVEDELMAYRRADNCVIDGSNLMLAPDIVQAFAFTIHELATNAAKYGALSQGDGRVEVLWTVEEADGVNRIIDLVWRERAAVSVSAPKRESYGLRTIRNLLHYECDATVDLDFRQSGLECRIVFPLSKSGEADLHDGAPVTEMSRLKETQAPQ